MINNNQTVFLYNNSKFWKSNCPTYGGVKNVGKKMKIKLEERQNINEQIRRKKKKEEQMTKETQKPRCQKTVKVEII